MTDPTPDACNVACDGATNNGLEAKGFIVGEFDGQCWCDPNKPYPSDECPYRAYFGPSQGQCTQGGVYDRSEPMYTDSAVDCYQLCQDHPNGKVYTNFLYGFNNEGNRDCWCGTHDTYLCADNNDGWSRYEMNQNNWKRYTFDLYQFFHHGRCDRSNYWRPNGLVMTDPTPLSCAYACQGATNGALVAIGFIVGKFDGHCWCDPNRPDPSDECPYRPYFGPSQGQCTQGGVYERSEPMYTDSAVGCYQLCQDTPDKVYTNFLYGFNNEGNRDCWCGTHDLYLCGDNNDGWSRYEMNQNVWDRYNFLDCLPGETKEIDAIITTPFSYKTLGDGFCKFKIGDELSYPRDLYNSHQVTEICAARCENTSTCLAFHVGEWIQQGVPIPYTVAFSCGISDSPCNIGSGSDAESDWSTVTAFNSENQKPFPVRYHIVRSQTFATFRCVTQCPTGKYLNGSRCEDCDTGKYNDQLGQYDCKNCISGKYNDLLGSTSESACKDCGIGKYSEAGSSSESACKECGPGYVVDAGRSTCEKCLAGKYEDVVDTCVDCPAGKYKTDGDLTCVDCAAGKYNSETGKAQCEECDAGKYNSVVGSTAESACKDCTAGEYQDQNGQSSCKECPGGWFSSLLQRRECTNCSPGMYQNQIGQSTCIDCEAGKYNNEWGQPSCEVCPVGKTSGASLECVDCVKGAYNDVAGGHICKWCEPGKYNNDTGQSSCKLCSKGTYSSEIGRRYSCITCYFGKYQDQEGQTICKDCGVAEYQDQHGQSSCKLCSKGTYSSEIGRMYSCITCYFGKYQDQEGQTICKDCGVGRYWEREYGQTECKECSAGKFNDQTGSQTKSTVCKDCAQGKFSLVGQESCSDWDTCVPGEIELVAPNAVQNRVCEACPSGFVVQNNQCVDCPENAVLVQEPGTNGACVCKPGWGYHNESCVECEAEYRQYNDVNSVLSEKGGVCANISCPIGQGFSLDSSAGDNTDISAHCAPCGDFSFSDNENDGECQPIELKNCDPGQHNEWDPTKQAECVACPDGKFKDSYGTDECKDLTVCIESIELVAPSKTNDRQCCDKTCLHGEPSVNNGLCECTCINGFSGSDCDECAAGKGVLNGVCRNCEYPQTSANTSASAQCMDQVCSSTQLVITEGFNSSLAHDDPANCKECPEGYRSYNNECFEVTELNSGPNKLILDDGSEIDISDLDNDNDGILNGDDPDDDNDGVPDFSETRDAQFNPLICRDMDNDGCDDCSITGQNASSNFTSAPDPSNDGVDLNGNGICDAGECTIENAGSVTKGFIVQYLTCVNNTVGGGLVRCTDPATWQPEFECIALQVDNLDKTEQEIEDDDTITEKQIKKTQRNNAKITFISALQNIGKKLKKSSYVDDNARKDALISAKEDRRTQLKTQMSRASGLKWWEVAITDDGDFEGYTDKVLSKRRGRPIKYRLATENASLIIDASSGGLDSIDLDADRIEVEVRVRGEAGKVKIVRNNETSYTLSCNGQGSNILSIGSNYTCKGRVWDIGSLTTDTGCVANANNDTGTCQCNLGYIDDDSTCVCDANYHVVDNECVVCDTGYVNDAGDVPSGNNTVCDVDTDGDGIADIVDPDDDNDGWNDDNETACGTEPKNNNSVPVDTDGDDICDAIDLDDDDDGWKDVNETACGTDPKNNNSVPVDTDGDNICDAIDPDDDNDGWNDDNETACGTEPKNNNSVPVDTDGDNICDALDYDIDGDGVSNANDPDVTVVDSDDFNPNVCSDTDNDTCDDCSSGTYDPSNDGVDTDGDGICDDGEDVCNSENVDAYQYISNQCCSCS